MARKDLLNVKIFGQRFAIGEMCGSRWYRWSDWKVYGLFWRSKGLRGFGIGPILFWDGR